MTLILVHINGYIYYADLSKRVLYEDKRGVNGVSFKYLTPNEYSQMMNEIKYPRTCNLFE